MKRTLFVVTAIACLLLFGLMKMNRVDAINGGPYPGGPLYFEGTYMVGGDNTYSDYWTPLSEHPDGWTYVYAWQDGSYLHVSIDVTADNTNDADDWTRLDLSRTDRFFVDATHPEWGNCVYGMTDRVSYEHKSCEFAIPLERVPTGNFDFGIAYYGTVAGLGVDLEESSDTGNSNSDDITNDTAPQFNITGCTLSWTVYLYRNDYTEGNHIESGICGLGSVPLTDSSAPEGENNYKVAQDEDGDGLGVAYLSAPLSVIVDTTAPTVTSGTIIGSNTVEIVFSEDVTGSATDYASTPDCDDGAETLIVDGATRYFSSLAGDATNASTLTVTGDSIPAGDTGSVYVNPECPPTSVEDLAGNDVAADTLVELADGQSDPVWYVDDGWDSPTNDGGHSWSINAFSSVYNAVGAATEDTTIHIASGSYEDSRKIQITDPGIRLIGPGKDVDTDDRAIITGTNCSRHVFSVQAADSRFEGLFIESRNGSGNGYCSVENPSDASPILRISPGAVDTEIYDNDLAGGIDGITFISGSETGSASYNNIHDNLHGISVNSQNTYIGFNDIYDNTSDIGTGYGIWFRGVCASEDGCNSSGTVVEGNDIYGNEYGIFYNALDQESPITIGPDNDIYNNSEGIYIWGTAHNIIVNGNKIHDNPGFTSGLHVEDDTNGIDVSENWWDSALGPNVNDEGPGSFPAETISTDASSSYIFWRPFCVDEDCAELSTLENVSPDDLADLFTTGTFVVDTSESVTAVSSVTVAEDVTITLPGGSTIELPAGTDITPTGGGTFNGNTLDADDIDESTLTGLGSGVVAEGALSWGAAVGLTFSPAITINVSVGTDLNGQTLEILRSADGGVTWTSDGIVAPATCTVAGGICTFQATKASTYASTKSSGGGGSSGSLLTAAQLAALFPPSVGPLARHNLREGDVFSATEGDPDVYIANEWGFKRLFLNPVIFSFYGHLGGWQVVKSVTAAVRDALPISGLFRNCEANDQKVYALEVTGEDAGTLHHVALSGDEAFRQDPDFFKKVFCINSNEFNWYAMSPIPYTILVDLPAYQR